MKLEVNLNDKKNGVELHFDKQPGAALFERLLELGFKRSFYDDLKWYSAQHPALIEYAKALEKALFEGRDFLSVPMQPSFEPNKAHIRANRFSYVIISYTKDGQTKRDHYVIFDSYKRVATDVATRFGREKYKEAFSEVEVYARNHKVKAGLLMELGKVITGTKDRQAGSPIENPAPLTKPPIPEITNEKPRDFFDKANTNGKLQEAMPPVAVTREFPYNRRKARRPMPVLRHYLKSKSNGTAKNHTDQQLKATVYPWQMTPLQYQKMKAGEKALPDQRNNPQHPVQQITEDQEPETLEMSSSPSVEFKEDYLDRMYGHLYLMYAEQKRPTNEQIQKLGQELGIPDRQMLWDAVVLSWLFWYKKIYKEPLPFEMRLEKMIRFWIYQQPTYPHRDSQTLYSQYSTPCPIAAMIARYTQMDKAESIFDPCAGNGMLLLGADIRKVHANEIDPIKTASLKYQVFRNITDDNAAKPFDRRMTKAYEVVVTNPPFGRWEAKEAEKERIVKKYFDSCIGPLKRIGLEHIMAGLALDCMKDNGKAAIIITGHLRFLENGLMDTDCSFFNWLYRHYLVSDIINIDGRLYNKQGTIEKTMLILINGRNFTSGFTVPKQQEAPHLSEVVGSFEQLWERIKPHVGYTIDTLIKQLEIELAGRGVSVADY